MAQAWTEQALIEGCRGGNRQAQRELYARTSGRIFRLLLKLTGNRDDALELAQETYLRAFARVGEFDGRSAITTWLYRIATNEGLQFLRHKKVEQTALPSIRARIDQSSENAKCGSPPDVAEALAKLPVDDRALVVLRFEEGLDYASISALIGCPVGTVASRLNSVRRRLRALLLKESPGPGEESEGSKHQIDRASAAPDDSGEPVGSREGGCGAAS